MNFSDGLIQLVNNSSLSHNQGSPQEEFKGCREGIVE